MPEIPRQGWSQKHHDLARAAGFPSWDKWCEAVEAEKRYKICGRIAAAKHPTAHPCGRRAGAGTKHGQVFGPCTHHGGDSLAGPEHGAYVHGKKMDPKYRLRGNLAMVWAHLEEHVTDAFDLQADARMLDARMVSLVESLPEDPATPRTLRKSISEVRRLVMLARSKGSKLTKDEAAALAAALQLLDERCGSALVETHVWEEWRRMAEQKRKVADTKARQDQRAHGPVLWQDVVMVTERVRQIVMEHVPAEHQSTVLKKFRAMLERPGVGEVAEA